MLQLLPVLTNGLTLEYFNSEKVFSDEGSLIQLSWNEIRDRAQAFAVEWKGVASEKSEAKSFWDAFFNIFGIPRRQVASFEEPVKAIKGRYHFIDIFWPGKMLVEHKSAGKNLDKASSQAFTYDPLTMRGDLRKAHAALDKAVDKCYRKEVFGSERERVEFLFGEYQKLINPLGIAILNKTKKFPRKK